MPLPAIVTSSIQNCYAQKLPMLSHVAGQIGDPQVRHRGTIGGSLAHGDPASDLPAAVLALDATLVVEGPSGRREIPAGDFFVGFLETAVGPDEMLTEIRVPKAPGGWSFQKFNRRAQDWATVGVAAATNGAGTDGAGTDGSGRAVRVALVNMGLTPLRATAVEEAVAGGASPADAAVLAERGRGTTERPQRQRTSSEAIWPRCWSGGPSKKRWPRRPEGRGQP